MSTGVMIFSHLDRDAEVAIKKVPKDPDGFSLIDLAEPFQSDAVGQSHLDHVVSAKRVIVFWSEELGRSPEIKWLTRAAIKAWSQNSLDLINLDGSKLPVGLDDIYQESSSRKCTTPHSAIRSKGRAPKSWLGATIGGIIILFGACITLYEDAGPAPLDRPRQLDNALPSTERTLRSGDEGTDVRILQEMLRAAGEPIKVTGFFDSETSEALKKIQRRAGLEANGEVDLGTLQYLFDGMPKTASRRVVLTPALYWAQGLEVWAVTIGAVGGGFLLAALILWLRARSRKQRQSPNLLPEPREVETAHSVRNGTIDVFVSYSRQDADRVMPIIIDIKAAGYHVWMDTSDMTGAQRYAGQIVGAIKATKVIALMASRNSFRSNHVVREVYCAGDLSKPFIHVVLDDAEIPDDFAYFLSGYPRIPAALIDHLRRHIDQLITTPTL